MKMYRVQFGSDPDSQAWFTAESAEEAAEDAADIIADTAEEVKEEVQEEGAAVPTEEAAEDAPTQ